MRGILQLVVVMELSVAKRPMRYFDKTTKAQFLRLPSYDPSLLTAGQVSTVKTVNITRDRKSKMLALFQADIPALRTH